MNNSAITIGRAEEIDFPELSLDNIPARIDTGARTSSVWASNVIERKGKLEFTLFDKGSAFFNGKRLKTGSYKSRVISSSMGEVQERYVVRLLVNLRGRKIRASFTLADRSTQVYPVLVGRNILRGKFVVDVKSGKPLVQSEKAKRETLQTLKVKKGDPPKTEERVRSRALKEELNNRKANK
jgi:hypothetical protein